MVSVRLWWDPVLTYISHSHTQSWLLWREVNDYLSLFLHCCDRHLPTRALLVSGLISGCFLRGAACQLSPLSHLKQTDKELALKSSVFWVIPVHLNVLLRHTWLVLYYLFQEHLKLSIQFFFSQSVRHSEYIHCISQWEVIELEKKMIYAQVNIHFNLHKKLGTCGNKKYITIKSSYLFG